MAKVVAVFTDIEATRSASFFYLPTLQSQPLLRLPTALVKRHTRRLENIGFLFEATIAVSQSRSLPLFLLFAANTAFFI